MKETETGRVTLHDLALRAKQYGAREAMVPYAVDEEEGSMLVVPSIDQAMSSFEWVVGAPVNEKTFTIPLDANATDPQSIYTVYRFKIARRLGNRRQSHPASSFEASVLREMPPFGNEILVFKSGGDVVVDGVLLKKRGSTCFSELLPRPYLLALAMDSSGRIGYLSMGCRAIFTVDGDELRPRDTKETRVTAGMKNRFGNSLSAFTRAFASPH